MCSLSSIFYCHKQISNNESSSTALIDLLYNTKLLKRPQSLLSFVPAEIINKQTNGDFANIFIEKLLNKIDP